MFGFQGLGVPSGISDLAKQSKNTLIFSKCRNFVFMLILESRGFSVSTLQLQIRFRL